MIKLNISIMIVLSISLATCQSILCMEQGSNASSPKTSVKKPWFWQKGQAASEPVLSPTASIDIEDKVTSGPNTPATLKDKAIATKSDQAVVEEKQNTASDNTEQATVTTGKDEPKVESTAKLFTFKNIAAVCGVGGLVAALIYAYKKIYQDDKIESIPS